MRTLVWSKTFLRSAKRLLHKNPEVQEDFEKALNRLVVNPFDVRLKTHKLKGKLSGTWACSVTYEYRIIFDFVVDKSENENDIFLIEIGTHDEVY